MRKHPCSIELIATFLLILSLAASFASAHDWRSVLARFEADGTLDATFGTGGVVIRSRSQIDAILQQPDGKLVAAGYDHPIGAGRDFAVARYETDGSLDATFGTGGVVTTSLGGNYDEAYAIVRQADGGFVGGGWRWNGSLNTDLSLALVRYSAAGVLDTTFGTGGIALVPNARHAIPVGLTEQPNGKLVMVAHITVDDVANIAVVRWQANGTLDTNFGDDGVATAGFSGSARRLCVYDRSGGGYTSPYGGSPSDPDGVWRSSGTTNLAIKYTSKTGSPDGIKKVILKLKSPPTKSSAQVQATGDLALAPFPLQKDPSVGNAGARRYRLR